MLNFIIGKMLNKKAKMNKVIIIIVFVIVAYFLLRNFGYI